jgi:hypothetical protein
MHTLGGAIMGRSAQGSVANSDGQTHDVTNLFVTDERLRQSSVRLSSLRGGRKASRGVGLESLQAFVGRERRAEARLFLKLEVTFAHTALWKFSVFVYEHGSSRGANFPNPALSRPSPFPFLRFPGSNATTFRTVRTR